MKSDIHPDYHKVVFVDSSTGNEWTTRSTITSKEKRDIDGEEVPVVRLEISSLSHPFWTGTMRELDTDGKIERFRKRYGTKKPARAKAAEEPAAEAEPTAEAEAPAE